MSAVRVPHVLNNPSWKVKHHELPLRERAWLSYERAKAVGLAHNLAMSDLATLSKKFWDLHTDPITCLDGAATTLLTIQYNLAAGTITQFSKGRPDLPPIVEDLLKFRKLGQFMLTETGHGLDVDNLETTATLQSNGEFILHSPTPAASKYMPPTVPTGIPTIAVVFARLLVRGEDRGVRPFLVPLNDGKEMCTGVTAQLLPYRELSCPVNHAITTFTNVRLPASALLGNLEKAEFQHIEFLKSIWRIAVGSIALGSIAIPASKLHTYIGAKYSLRRTVGKGDRKVSLLHYRTQQIPILNALAQSYVLEAFQKWATERFSDVDEDMRVRHGIATCLKAVGVQTSQAIALSVSERCGAQGVQAVNMMTNMHAEMRGIAIAEGDILVLSIRLATELLLERYEMPETTNPNSLLALHEAGLFTKYRAVLNAAPHHRSQEVNKHVTIHGQRIVEAIGHRMAYDAAVASGVNPDLIALYVSSIMLHDPAWYSENAGMSISKQEDFQADALDAVLPQVESLVKGLGVQEWVSAPIASDQSWEDFVDRLEVFSGNAQLSLELPIDQDRLARL